MTQSVRTGLVAAFFTAGLAFGQSPSPAPAMPPPAPAASAPTAIPKTVELKDQKGKLVGTVLLVDTPHGLLLRGALSGLPAGTHAIHFHEIGKCEAPFKSSGGHFNPTKKNHGMLDPGGLHAGDLPNLVIPKSGKLDFELFAEDLTLADGPNTVLDVDGTALVIHAKADDYKSQPAGDAGDRIACGVITK
jgi:superoxide dismutase, Cu-Zn family